MIDLYQLAALYQHRAALYRFLSGAYLWEINARQLDAMQRMQLPRGTGVETLDEGYALLKDFLAAADETCLEELAVDYARVFLAAGAAQGLAAFPYASVYVSKQRLVAQQAHGDAGAIYAAKGLAPNPEAFRVPNDHIGLQLAFMAYLCDEAAVLTEKGDCVALGGNTAQQKAFLENHLYNWYANFCRDVAQYAHTAFYKAIAKITDGFMVLEQAFWETEAGYGI